VEPPPTILPDVTEEPVPTVKPSPEE
jgi:hypothetical protein